MKNHVVKIAALLFLLAIGAASTAQAAELDITPLFAGYESGCDISGIPASRLVYWANPNEQGKIAPTSALPPIWRGHVGSPVVEDRHEHWFVKVPLREVRFHGLREIRLERWYGKGCGISGWSLVLDAPIDAARRHIDEKAFKLDENLNFKPELAAEPSSRTTQVVCDVSM